MIKILNILRTLKVFCATPTLLDRSIEDYSLTHVAWIERTVIDLSRGAKWAIVAYDDRSRPIGVIVYMRSTLRWGKIAIRNISVILEERGRGVGSSLLDAVERTIWRDSPDGVSLVLDTKLTNLSVVAFVEKHGYVMQEVLDLYDSTNLDGVFVKVLPTSPV